MRRKTRAEGKYVKFSGRLEHDLSDFIRITAAKRGCSMNDIIVERLEKYRKKMLTLNEDVA